MPVDFFPNAANRRILCVGEALVDLIGPLTADWNAISSFIPRIGGAPANMAVAISRLGGQAAFLGCIADDEPGNWINQRLRSEGVDLTFAKQRRNAQTRIALVTGEESARSFVFYGSPPADALLEPDDIASNAIADVDAVLLGSLPLVQEPSRSAIMTLIDQCRRRNVPIFFDPNPRSSTWPDPAAAIEQMNPVFKSARLIKLSSADLPVLNVYPDDIRQLQPPDSVLILTDGERGSRYWYGNDMFGPIPAPNVTPVDPTGAGDAFMATVVLRMVTQNRAISTDDLRIANIIGALTTTKPGGMDALPDIETILRYYTDDTDRAG